MWEGPWDTGKRDTTQETADKKQLSLQQECVQDKQLLSSWAVKETGARRRMYFHTRKILLTVDCILFWM